MPSLTSGRLALAAALTGALLVAACGGDDDSPAASNTEAAQTSAAAGDDSPAPATGDASQHDVAEGVDACELISPEEAAETLGADVGEPERGSAGPFESCTYSAADASLKLIVVQVRSGISKEQFESETLAASAFVNEGEVQAIEGLGDSAYNFGGLLYAHQGSYEIVMSSVLGFDFTDEEQSAQATAKNIELTRLALDRLPE